MLKKLKAALIENDCIISSIRTKWTPTFQTPFKIELQVVGTIPVSEIDIETVRTAFHEANRERLKDLKETRK